jgi:hypothetical protein
MLYTGYREQYDRVQRWLKRIEASHHDSATYLDFMWAFYQNCWALKDWISNDNALDSSIRETVENEVKTYKNLMICADLANRSKHLVLDRRPRVGAEVESISVSISTGWPSTDAAPIIIHQYKVVGNSGELGDGLAIARDAVAEWAELLNQWKLSS